MAGGRGAGLGRRRSAPALPPFAVAAVDGGEATGTSGRPATTPARWCSTSSSPMLADQGLDTSRVGFLGWSMGGYGALLLGARLGAGPHRGDLRREPGTVDVVGRGGAGRVRRRRGLRGQQRVGAARARRRSRSGSTAATAIRSTRRLSSSSRSCRTPPAGGFSPGGHDGGVLELAADRPSWTWMAPLWCLSAPRAARSGPRPQPARYRCESGCPAIGSS